jgi:heavy metal sensor kinase
LAGVLRILRRTRARLALIQLVALALAAAVAGASLFNAVAVPARQDADNVLYEQAGTIAGSLTPDQYGGYTYKGGSLPEETDGGVAVEATIVVDGAVVAHTKSRSLSTSVLVQIASQVAGSGASTVQDARGLDNQPRRVYAQTLQFGPESPSPTTGASPSPAPAGPVPVLILSRSTAELNSTLNRLLFVVVAIGILAVAGGGTLAYLLAGRVLRPVRTITGIARSLSEEDLHKRVDLKVPDDELGELVATFNQMLARLEASFESLRRFTADASHELRAPLTLMRTEVEVALTNARTKEDYEDVLRSVQEEVQHLSRVSDHLLLLARADAGALIPNAETVDVADFVHEQGERWREIARAGKISVEVQAPDSGTVVADPALLRRVLDNLLDNAIRHSPALSTIRLSAAAEAGGWAFEVADQGPGIPPEHRSVLFTRFARADTARSRQAGGAGLGLALSEAIARAHGGELNLVDSLSGAVFRLHLPETPPTMVLRKPGQPATWDAG